MTEEIRHSGLTVALNIEWLISSKMILLDDDLDSSVDQRDGLCNEYSNNHWQNRTAAVTDEFLKLKFQMETAQRDKERDLMLILSLKHV